MYPATTHWLLRHAEAQPLTWHGINARPLASLVADNHRNLSETFWLAVYAFGDDVNWTLLALSVFFLNVAIYCISYSATKRKKLGIFAVCVKMTGVFDSLNTDMHSNQITSNSYHSLHKSQESPTLPVSTATDSSYYNNQQPGHCAGSPYGQLGSYQYHSNGLNGVQYNNKSYELGFNSSFGTYGSYGSSASPTPTDAGKQTLNFYTLNFNTES